MRVAALCVVACVTWSALVSGSARAQDQGGSVTFQVDHVRSDEGHVRVDVCTRDTFLQGGCPYSGEAPAVKGMTTVVVSGVPPGVYAAQVYHDRNDDHTVNRSRPLGIPREEIGFSNNAPIGFRGPRWDNAAFTHDSADQALAVKLHRYQSP